MKRSIGSRCVLCLAPIYILRMYVDDVFTINNVKDTAVDIFGIIRAEN